MHTETYKIKGMHCASCAVIIEQTIRKNKGVALVQVNYGTETVKISFDETKTSPENLSKKIEPYGYSIITPVFDSVNISANEHNNLRAYQSGDDKFADRVIITSFGLN